MFLDKLAALAHAERCAKETLEGRLKVGGNDQDEEKRAMEKEIDVLRHQLDLHEQAIAGKEAEHEAYKREAEVRLSSTLAELNRRREVAKALEMKNNDLEASLAEMREVLAKTEKERQTLEAALGQVDKNHAAEMARLRLHYEQQLYILNMK